MKREGRKTAILGSMVGQQLYFSSSHYKQFPVYSYEEVRVCVFPCMCRGAVQTIAQQRGPHLPRWTTSSGLLLNMIQRSHGHTTVKMDMTPLSLAAGI